MILSPRLLRFDTATRLGSAGFRYPAALLCFGLLFLALFPSPAWSQASQEKRQFDVPGGEARVTLKEFAQQAGQQVVYPTHDVEGIMTLRIKGEFPVREAINLMLTGTGLVAIFDEKSATFSVSRIPVPNAERAAPQMKAAALQAAVEPQDANQLSRLSNNEAIQLETYEVTGTRLRGLLEGATAQPVMVIDSAQIERTGASSLSDLFRYIPQVSAFTTGQALTQTSISRLVNVATGAVTLGSTAATMNDTAGRVTATLAGSPAGSTLLLIDGQRAPKNNQTSGGDGYDLSSIPLAAIERVEVLLDGASSIYGADAMGGVINVILKKNYQGTELRFSYDNAFNTDVGIVTTSLTHGFSAGKLRGMVTAEWQKANAMDDKDRYFLESWDRTPFGGTNLISSVYPGGAGRVSVSSGTLPGLTTSSAAIPSGSLGTGLTVANYASAGAIAAPLDLGPYVEYASPYHRFSGLAMLDYDYAKWLQIHAEFRGSRDRNYSSPQPLQAQNLSIPAGYPGNPFGVAVTLNKYFFDVMPELYADDNSDTEIIRVSGQLPKGWHYAGSISLTHDLIHSNGDSGNTIVAANLTAAIAAGQTPNLFYDSSTVKNPNAPGVLQSLTTLTQTEEKDEDWAYQLQTDGPVYSLPAGDIMTAWGVERREEYTRFPVRAATDTSSALPGEEWVNAFYGEANIPVFGKNLNYPALRQLNISGSYRWEKYVGEDGTGNPRVGLAWRPLDCLLVRASVGSGFEVPTLAQRTAPTTTTYATLGTTSTSLDPLRGNTLNPTSAYITRGGNPNLSPQKSTNKTAGVVLDVPWIKGLSVSVQYFQNEYKDMISTLLFGQMALYFPNRITRGPNLPTDQAGWAGPVTAADLRAVNIAYSQTSGYNVSADYNRHLAFGDVRVQLAGTEYVTDELIPTPGQPPSTTVNKTLLPVQLNGNAFFYRDAWGLGVLSTYRAKGKPSTTLAFTPSAIRWDMQGDYDFSKAAWVRNRKGTLVGKALEGTKSSLTIFDLLNSRPPFDYSGFPDNTVIDSRMRRYAVSVRKQF